MGSTQKGYHLPADAPPLVTDTLTVTGCSQGIGRALCTLVLSKGHRLVATARNPTTGLSYLPESTPSSQLLKLPLDVTSRSSIDAALDASIAHFGRLDVIVNNAGMFIYGNTENTDEADGRAVFETNFWGPMTITQRAVGIMRDVNPKSPSCDGAQGGVILNVTSFGGRVAVAGSAFYDASKVGLEAFTECMAQEVKPEWNIHLSCIQPGGVRTGFISGRKRIDEHPAYKGFEGTLQIVERYFDDPQTPESWNTPESMAEGIYETVSSDKEIPRRVPLGHDAWTVLMADHERTGRELEAGKDLQ
ncbi:short-chain dehydrogenase/reductase-like protein SDR [Neurospora tetraspora]|uniref:Short-chain dehydrogenase/reductase-like protein SDR n=1 Tax=Neurospora tetraspora TaxID=94610 RepID=A0AAE0J715_9PEZI|nr:short-chain dehydrogenase/reductase-like protein SDR [Neurospora tetraspora]